MLDNTKKLKLFMPAKEEVEVYRLGLLIGYFSKQITVEWADKIIEKSDKPDYIFIETSLSKNKDKNEIIHLLESFKGKYNKNLPVKILVSLMHQDLKDDIITALEFSRYFNRLSEVSEVPSEDKIWMICFDDEYEEARGGLFGDIDSLNKELINYFSKYKKFKFKFNDFV